MQKAASSIPLCQSPFLQDVTIALGRRSLKSLRQHNPTLVFDVSIDHQIGTELERLDIEARNWSGQLTQITLWADGMAWVYAREKLRKHARKKVMFRANAYLSDLSAEEIAQLIRTTLADISSSANIWRARAIE